MRIAFTSSDGIAVDRHFGEAEAFAVWEVCATHSSFVELVPLTDPGDDGEDRILARADALRGCTLVYTQQIGGPAAAKLVARRIHPLKTPGTEPVTALVDRLQQVLRSGPPPWLARALGQAVDPRCSTAVHDDET